MNDSPRAHIRVFERRSDGTLGGGALFADRIGNGVFEDGIVDGMKCDALGNVWVTGPGGIWVFTPKGERIGTIRFPEQSVNFAFGGEDLRTLFCCAHTSVYTLRVKVPGQPHPWYRVRGNA